MAERVGFIGLGIMGGGMSRNLLAAGFELTVHNRTPERMRPLAGVGAATAASPAEVAAKGTLSIMVGGAEAEVRRAMPYLEAMGSAITHVGPTGAGQSCKLVNQILVVVTMLGVAEALVFAQAGGLDLERTLQAVGGGAGGSWMLSNRGGQAIHRDWRPGFTIDLQQKYLRLGLEAADETGAPVLASSTVFQLYRTLQRAGFG